MSKNFVHVAPKKPWLNQLSKKKLLEKFIFINFQPFQKQIKVSTKFHNFKSPEMKKKNRPPAVAGDPL